MSVIDYPMIRDQVIDWMATAAPVYLQDDKFMENLLYIVCPEVTRAVMEERERQQKRLREVSTC